MLKKYFAGTAPLVRFTLRRDRVRLPVWVLGLAGLTVSMVPVYGGMFSSEAELQAVAATMGNPAMIALVGPVYGVENFHVGAMFANQMLLFMCVVAAVMNVFLVTRHTRGDEERGRLEMVRSLSVGRLSGLGATLLTALGANVLIAGLTGLGMSLFNYSGITLTGSVLFGAAMGVTGLFFAAATAVICQLTANNRTATGLSLSLLMLLYLMRAAGDLGGEALALASPLGLVLRSKVFVENIWRPVVTLLAAALLLGALALYLAGRRDLGRGLLPGRPGRRHGSKWLSSPLGLALRLSRSTVLVWAGAIFLFAAVFASVLGDMEQFFSGDTALAAILGGEGAFAQQYIALMFAMMSVLATVPVLGLFLRVRGEERRGFTEHLLGGSVSRTAQYTVYLGIALGASVLLQLLTALGFWVAARWVTDAGPALGTLLGAGAAYLPAMWVLLGLAGLLAGWLPRWTGLAYGYLGLGFFLIYVGSMVQLPPWTGGLVTYSRVARVPAEPIEIIPLAGMAALAAALAVAGFVGCRRRDLLTTG